MQYCQSFGRIEAKLERRTLPNVVVIYFQNAPGKNRFTKKKLHLYGVQTCTDSAPYTVLSDKREGTSVSRSNDMPQVALLHLLRKEKQIYHELETPCNSSLEIHCNYLKLWGDNSFFRAEIQYRPQRQVHISWSYLITLITIICVLV